MDQATPVVDHYIAEFARMENTLPGAVAIMEQRKQALQAFTSHGFPTIREEDWKYTKLRKLQKSVFELSDTPGTVTAQTLSKHLPDDLDAHRAVVVDGYYRADLSQLDGLPEGVHVRSFAEYLETDAEASIRHPLITDQPGSPSDMNAAFVTDGVLITVDAGVVVDKPLHVVTLATGSEELRMAQVRHRFILQPNSEAQIIEHYVGAGEETYFTNAVTEIVTHDNAQLTRCRLQEESETGGQHISSMFAHQLRDSRVYVHSFDLGGQLARIDTNSRQVADNAEIGLYGVYAPTGRQHIDNHTRVDHTTENGISREVFKGVVGERGRAVFNGKIVVHKYAQKTDSEQSCDTLLLSKKGEIDAKPELEIYADDVKCAHGSTVGQLDENAVFYLRSRGIGDTAARAVLTYSFANELVNMLDSEALQHHIEATLMAKLPGGDIFATVA